MQGYMILGDIVGFLVGDVLEDFVWIECMILHGLANDFG